MESIKVGKEIYSLLNGNADLTALVGNKIYPIIVEKDTTYPFIVYKRSSITPTYTKDFHLSDEVIVDIVCVSNSYTEGIDVAGLVRNTLEDKRIQGIQSIKLDSADEDFINDAYVQTLSFILKIA